MIPYRNRLGIYKIERASSLDSADTNTLLKMAAGRTKISLTLKQRTTAKLIEEALNESV